MKRGADWVDDDDEGIVILLSKVAPEASVSSLSLWRDRLLWAAEDGPMDPADWRAAKEALRNLRKHLAAAQASEAAVPAWLREQISYRLPIGSTSDILEQAVRNLEGKIDLAERIVAGHFERNPPRRGNPSFAYSDAQLAVARTAALFWQQGVGEVPTAGRSSDGRPTTDFGKFLDRILDKLDMSGSAGLLAEKAVTSISN